MTSTPEDPDDGVSPSDREIMDRFERVAPPIGPERAALQDKQVQYQKQREARYREPTEAEAQAIGALVKYAARLSTFVQRVVLDDPQSKYHALLDVPCKYVDEALEVLDPLRATNGLHADEALELERLESEEHRELQARYDAELAREQRQAQTHFKLGDSSATMHLACGLDIKDTRWTENPHEVECEVCAATLAELAREGLV